MLPTFLRKTMFNESGLYDAVFVNWQVTNGWMEHSKTFTTSIRHKKYTGFSARSNILRVCRGSMGIWYNGKMCQLAIIIDQKRNQVKLFSLWILLKITFLVHRKSYLVISGQFEHSSESLFQPIGSHIANYLPQFHMKSWPKVKLGQVEVGSNIAQNHSSRPYEVISAGHYLPQFIWKVDQKWNYVKLESVGTLLKVTRLACKVISGHYWP